MYAFFLSYKTLANSVATFEQIPLFIDDIGLANKKLGRITVNHVDKVLEYTEEIFSID